MSHWEMSMYMSIPMMSLVMDMNGPVARAGSILKRSRVRGTKVPKIEANSTTAISDSDTARVVGFHGLSWNAL